MSFVLLLSSFDHKRDIFVTTTFGDIVSFCCLGKTSQAFSRDRTTFSIANFDYKTPGFHKKAVSAQKCRSSEHTHTHTDSYPRFTPTHGSGNECTIAHALATNNTHETSMLFFKIIGLAGIKGVAQIKPRLLQST